MLFIETESWHQDHKLREDLVCRLKYEFIIFLWTEIIYYKRFFICFELWHTNPLHTFSKVLYIQTVDESLKIYGLSSRNMFKTEKSNDEVNRNNSFIKKFRFVAFFKGKNTNIV